ncbi:MAG: hypothetical protein O7D91_09295 [Planctomycetota bacterium]|nr:hypothetical protein [Planctomycetota bacterium]
MQVNPAVFVLELDVRQLQVGLQHLHARHGTENPVRRLMRFRPVLAKRLCNLRVQCHCVLALGLGGFTPQSQFRWQGIDMHVPPLQCRQFGPAESCPQSQQIRQRPITAKCFSFGSRARLDAGSQFAFVGPGADGHQFQQWATSGSFQQSPDFIRHHAPTRPGLGDGL